MGLIRKLLLTVKIRDRLYLLKSYKKCFIGSDFISAIITEINCSKEEALRIGNNLMSMGERELGLGLGIRVRLGLGLGFGVGLRIEFLP
jgi:hypothetical protein